MVRRPLTAGTTVVLCIQDERSSPLPPTRHSGCRASPAGDGNEAFGLRPSAAAGTS